MKQLLFVAVFVALVGSMFAQSDYQQVVFGTTSGNKTFLDINMPNLQESVDTLFARIGAAQGSSSSITWGDVLSTGSNPGMDINFSSYDITGLGGLTSTGTLTADSLILNKDADITGRFSVTDVVSMGDSLTVSGYVEFADSLEVLRAVTIGETLHVTALTTLGDSLHVAGNVDFDALFNVDGAATFGSTLTVTGQTTLNDSLHVNSGANISGTLYADSISVTDVIDGQVNSLGNHDTDDLAEGSTNLYLTPSERASIASMVHAIDSLSCTWTKHEGYVYELILIGDQCWFAENLRTTVYADGTSIPEVTDNTAWTELSSGARAAYDNDMNNVDAYGYLYNGHAALDERGLCPTGWHVSTEAEWDALVDFVGGEEVAAAKLKSSYSDSPNWDGQNSFGFSAVPAGSRAFGDGSFYGAASSSTDDYTDALFHVVAPDGDGGLTLKYAYMYSYPDDPWTDWIYFNFFSPKDGNSVRCVRD